MNLILDHPYLSGYNASTDLHAGGIFFCILYKNSIVFHEGGKVTLTHTDIHPVRPMDDFDVERIKNHQNEGTYTFNQRGYLECHFTVGETNITYTGMIIETHPGILAFNVYNSKGQSSSCVFVREKHP